MCLNVKKIPWYSSFSSELTVKNTLEVNWELEVICSFDEYRREREQWRARFSRNLNLNWTEFALPLFHRQLLPAGMRFSLPHHELEAWIMSFTCVAGIVHTNSPILIGLEWRGTNNNRALNRKWKRTVEFKSKHHNYHLKFRFRSFGDRSLVNIQV